MLSYGWGTEEHEQNVLLAVYSHSHHVWSIFFIGSHSQSVVLIGVKFSLSPKTGLQDDDATEVILLPNTMVKIAIKVPDEVTPIIVTGFTVDNEMEYHRAIS
ncbi:unnamed protein product [Zymoseptoria tritici ST99CH_3D1]|nr:unnamed protein product [Zymoseptoria tritici ST99CH_3D1]